MGETAIEIRLTMGKDAGNHIAKLPVDAHGPVSFSPDGRRLAFINSHRDVFYLYVADANGEEARQLATRTSPERFIDIAVGPAWSPDGDEIACAVKRYDGGGYFDSVIAVRVADGVERPMTARRWSAVGQLAWLPGGAGLVVAARESPSEPSQIWQLPPSGGDARRVTNDLNDYSGVSYNAETRSLLAVQTHVVSGVWVVPSGDLKVQAVARGHFPLDAATQIASGTSPVNPCDSPAAKARCRRAFLLMAGGSFTKKAIRPARGSGACRPTVASQPPSAETRAQKPDVSPDGKLIAYYTLDSDSASSPWIFGAMPFEGGGLLKRFTFSPTVGERLVRWVPGGWGLTYVDSPGGVSNIWVQPLQGGAPRQLSDFKAERIGSFDWSPDGRRLAVVGGTETSDVVLIEAKSE